MIRNIFVSIHQGIPIEEASRKMVAHLRQLSGICVPLVILASCSGQIASDEKARAAIEQLHQLDKNASLSDKADELEKLWDPEGVRIQPGRPAEVGRQVIYDND